MKSLTSAATFLILGLLVSTGTAQQQPKETKEGKQSAPLAVKLNVTITDSAGHPIGSLTQDQFRVFEDDVPQTLTSFGQVEGPLAFGLAIDTSGSLRTQLGSIVTAAKLVADNSPPEDEVLVIRFISSDRIEVVQDFTADRRALARALDDLFVQGGQTAIIDAVWFANDRITNHTKGKAHIRRSLVLITDGEDRASHYKLEQLFLKLRETGLQVFVVGFVRELDTKHDRERAVNFLNRLAQETGGNAYYPEHASDFERIAKEIVSELSAPYALGYDSTNSARDGRFRKVRVEVINQSKDVKLTAIAREGYTAPKN